MGLDRAGAGALVFAQSTASTISMTAARIDTHQHIVPPTYAEWLVSKGMAGGGMPIPKWSPDQALDTMADNDVDAAILSISTPGVHLGDDLEARSKAREVNEYQPTS